MISIVVSLMMSIAIIIVIMTIIVIIIMTGKRRRMAIGVVSSVLTRTMIGIPISGSEITAIIFVNSRKFGLWSFWLNEAGLAIWMRHRSIGGGI